MFTKIPLVAMAQVLSPFRFWRLGLCATSVTLELPKRLRLQFLFAMAQRLHLQCRVQSVFLRIVLISGIMCEQNILAISIDPRSQSDSTGFCTHFILTIS